METYLVPFSSIILSFVFDLKQQNLIKTNMCAIVN